MTHNPYRTWVESFDTLLRAGAAIGGAPARTAPPSASGRKTLIFAPHPDDEVIIGALPLRLARECGHRIVNVAVTLGSNPERRAARWRELTAACDTLGFGLVTPDPAGLEGISPAGRAQHPASWQRAVAAVAGLIEAERPNAVFLPHADDWNQTHIGTNALVTEAMRALPNLACLVIETEFWGAMAAPNLMIESSSADVADLVAALSLHEGEVARNPYHLRLPAWMIDNVRRGAELVGGQGGGAPNFTFATLYRIRAWRGGGPHRLLDRGVVIGKHESLPDVLARGPERPRARHPTTERSMNETHSGTCFCGAVELRVSGQPNAMGYCHCRSCRSWSAGPVNAFTLWPPQAVEVVRGGEHVETFAKTPMSQRKFCRLCGGHLMANHPPLGMIDVFAATIPTLPFKPAVHVNYAETVLPMRDGLPKLADFPTEFGGTGQTLPE